MKGFGVGCGRGKKLSTLFLRAIAANVLKGTFHQQKFKIWLLLMLLLLFGRLGQVI